MLTTFTTLTQDKTVGVGTTTNSQAEKIKFAGINHKNSLGDFGVN